MDQTTEFRTRPGRLLPGSLTVDGAVIDYAGDAWADGPCFMDLRKMKPARRAAMGRAGWKIVPANQWPNVSPGRGLQCIRRELPDG